jgi:hypothetical protein
LKSLVRNAWNGGQRRVIPVAARDRIPISATPKLTQIILTGPYLGTTNSILTMLESRSLPHKHCSSLIAAKIGMKGRSLTLEEIARYYVVCFHIGIDFSVEKLDGSNLNSEQWDHENGHIMQD